MVVVGLISRIEDHLRRLQHPVSDTDQLRGALCITSFRRHSGEPEKYVWQEVRVVPEHADIERLPVMTGRDIQVPRPGLDNPEVLMLTSGLIGSAERAGELDAPLECPGSVEVAFHHRDVGKDVKGAPFALSVAEL